MVEPFSAGQPRHYAWWLVPRPPRARVGGGIELLEIEIGDARVRVGRGFDHELLAEVVGVLHRVTR